MRNMNAILSCMRSGLFMFVCPFVLLMFVLSVLFDLQFLSTPFVSSNSSYYPHRFNNLLICLLKG